MTNPRCERCLAATGLVDVLLSLVALLLVPPPPAVGASAKALAAYYATQGDTALVSGYLSMLALIFFFCFVTYVSTILDRAESGPTTLSRLCFGAALVSGTDFLVFLALAQTLPLRAAASADLVVGHALSDLVNMGLTASAIPAAVLVGAASVVILRTVVIQRWVGLLGLVVGAVLLLASLSLLVRSGPLAAGGIVFLVGYGSFLLWELVLGLVLLVSVGARSRKAPPLPSLVAP